MAGKNVEKTEAQRLVQRLVREGTRETAIAAALDVHFHTVTRWRDGKTEPHAGHLRKLKALVKGNQPTAAAS